MIYHVAGISMSFLMLEQEMGRLLCFFEVLDEKDINNRILLLMVDQVRVHIS